MQFFEFSLGTPRVCACVRFAQGCEGVMLMDVPALVERCEREPGVSAAAHLDG